MRWLLVLVAVSGCSVALTRNTPRADGTCSSAVPTVLDGVATAALTAMTVRAHLAAGGDCGNQEDCRTFDLTGLFLVPAIIYGASTVWGVVSLRACAAARR